MAQRYDLFLKQTRKSPKTFSVHTCEPYYIIRERLIALAEGEDDNLASGAEAEGDEASEACGDEEGLRTFGVPVVELPA